MDTFTHTLLAAIFITFYIWGVIEVRMFISKRIKKHIKALKKSRKSLVGSLQMASRFQIVKWIIGKKTKYTINEVFTDANSIIGMNNKPVVLEGESLESLHRLMDRILNDMSEHGVYTEDDDAPIDKIDKGYYDYETEERTEDLVDIFKRMER